MVPALASLTILALISPALAHGAPSGSSLHWNGDPWVVLPLLVAGALYASGIARLWRRAGAGRGVRKWQAASFAAGWFSLVIALLSPLDSLADGLFIAHMIEHGIVMVIAAPLIAIARPWGAMAWGLPPSSRRGLGRLSQIVSRTAVWRFISAPTGATALHGVVLWIWHAPLLYNAALVSETMHRLQHLSFFATALLFWRAIVSARPATFGLASGCVFVTLMHSGFLGMLLTFSRAVWFPNQGSAARSFGLTPLEDQQLAGLVMWFPSGIVYMTVSLVLVARWIDASVPRIRPLRALD